MPSHLRWFFVSIPLWAFLHFYEKETVIEKTVDVSMPLWAFLHFYPDKLTLADLGCDVCQCPYGLSFISTPHSRDEGQCSCSVSMPFWAFLHFYVVDEWSFHWLLVSMPFWAFLHFYSILLEPAETKHFPGLFCRYLSENSENKVFQIVFCTVHNLFIF